MPDPNAAVQAWFTERLRAFHAGRFQAFLDDSDPDEEQNPREHELSIDAVKVDRNKEWPTLPEAVKQSAEFYFTHVESEDWGSVRVFRVPTPIVETYAVRVTTDGDDGWLEVYDRKGDFLGAGRTYIELIAWAPAEEVRKQFGDNWPEALDRSQTLWKLPEPPPPEPPFKVGQEVECRWQRSSVWFPAKTIQAELDRVEVEFDNGSHEWIDVDYVREVEAGQAKRTALPGMDALTVGDKLEFEAGGYELYYPATVVERLGNRIRMQKSDGEEEWTLPSRCRPLTPDEPEPLPPLAVNDYVDCRWCGTSELKKGWINQREGDRLLIEYEDGEEEWTTTGKCRRLAEEVDEPGGPTLSIGDRVECRYRRSDNYYPGKVTKRRGNRIFVEYDDGAREWTTPGMCRLATS